ncbi:helix-turn-helix domain-containing protein [Pseudonocardia sp. CA-107938]|uniref:helix-turn-helix domain-containing protein n=1 Tax=Pseudonocardia sp. CA-107938 TaxID=3240021 RepID=UPI003D8BAA38
MPAVDQFAERGAIPEWLARELIAARQRLGLNREKAARRCDCSPRTIRHLEAPDRRPSRSMAYGVIAGLQLAPNVAEALLKHAADEAGRDRRPDGPPSSRRHLWAALS